MTATAPAPVEAGRLWHRVSMVRLTDRLAADVAPARRWSWVQWRVPGQAPRLALMGPLAARTGLIEFTLRRRGKRGAWIRPLRSLNLEKKGSP